MLDPSIVDNLKTFRSVSKLKTVALNIFVKMLDTKEIRNLRKIFMNLDSEG